MGLLAVLLWLVGIFVALSGIGSIVSGHILWGIVLIVVGVFLTRKGFDDRNN